MEKIMFHYYFHNSHCSCHTSDTSRLVEIRWINPWMFPNFLPTQIFWLLESHSSIALLVLQLPTCIYRPTINHPTGFGMSLDWVKMSFFHSQPIWLFFLMMMTGWILVVQGSHFLNNLSVNKISKATVQLIKMIDRWEIVLEFYCDLYLIASSPRRQFLDNVPLLERYCRTIFFLS